LTDGYNILIVAAAPVGMEFAFYQIYPAQDKGKGTPLIVQVPEMVNKYTHVKIAEGSFQSFPALESRHNRINHET
jgi:hypothetical protein